MSGSRMHLRLRSLERDLDVELVEVACLPASFIEDATGILSEKPQGARRLAAHRRYVDQVAPIEAEIDALMGVKSALTGHASKTSESS